MPSSTSEAAGRQSITTGREPERSTITPARRAKSARRTSSTRARKWEISRQAIDTTSRICAQDLRDIGRQITEHSFVYQSANDRLWTTHITAYRIPRCHPLSRSHPPYLAETHATLQLSAFRSVLFCEQETPVMPATTITNINTFLQLIENLPSKDTHFVYRGQKNSEWELESAAMRRLLRTYGQLFRESPSELDESFLHYHDHTLLSSARERGFGYDNGQNLTDLELLAKLQHFGGATGLIDFTRNPLVALWFACEDDTHDGTLFVLASAPLPDLTQLGIPGYGAPVTIRDVFRYSRSDDEATTWEPPLTGDATPRIIAQQSVFVIDQSRGLQPSVIHAVTIPADAKDPLRDSLAGLGVTQHSLFVDFYGFATNNKFDSPTAYAVDESFAIGLRFHRFGDFPQAISKYNEYISNGNSNGEVHFLRGNAYAGVGEHRLAIEEYNRTIDEFKQELQHVRHLVHYNRANAKVQESDMDGAIDDYNAALTLDTNYKDAIYNRGNTHALVGNHEDAIADFEKLHENKDAAFNKGNALLWLGRFDEAMDSYGIAFDGEDGGILSGDNARELSRLQDLIGDQDAEVRIGAKSEPRGLIYQDPRRTPVEIDGERPIEVIVDLDGKRLLRRDQRLRLEGNRQHRGNAGYKTSNGAPFGRRKIILVRVLDRGQTGQTGDLPFE